MSIVPPAQHENITAGIGWMLLTSFCFVSVDTVGKYLLESYPLTQVVWCRFLFHFLLTLVIAALWFRDTIKTNRPWTQLGRSALLAILTILYYFGLARTDLATAMTIIFMSPIFVTILSIPLLGEPAGARRIIGVLVGFLGALVVVRPGIVPVSIGMLCLLGAAVINALFQIVTRHLRHDDKPMTTSLYTALAGAIGFTAVGPLEWQAPDARGWALLVVFGFIGGVAQLCLIKSFHVAPAAVVAPFSYTSIVWATLFGILIFGDFPNLWTIIGALLIIGSGLYIFYGERSEPVAAPSRST